MQMLKTRRNGGMPSSRLTFVKSTPVRRSFRYRRSSADCKTTDGRQHNNAKLIISIIGMLTMEDELE